LKPKVTSDLFWEVNAISCMEDVLEIREVILGDQVEQWGWKRGD